MGRLEYIKLNFIDLLTKFHRLYQDNNTIYLYIYLNNYYFDIFTIIINYY